MPDFPFHFRVSDFLTEQGQLVRAKRGFLLIEFQALQLVAEAQARVRNLGTSPKAYAELLEIYEELEQAAAIHRRLGCPVIEVSELSIEETAQRVIRIVEQRRAEVRAS